MTDAPCEQMLTGGAQTPGVVRIGSAVHRPAHSRSEYVQDLLRHLERVGFEGAPQALGYDEQSGEVVSYVPGFVPHRLPFELTDAQLVSAAGLIRRYHDAAASWPDCEGHETICHGDLGPHNMVFRAEAAVAIIDWDADVRPGRRADDFAHAVWCCADLLEPAVPVAEQSRKLTLMCDQYPGMSPTIVIVELQERFARARRQHAGAGRQRGVEVFDGLLSALDALREEFL